MPQMSRGGVIKNPGSSKETPTGGWRTLRPVWDKEKCVQCMQCWLYCPDSSIPLKEGKRIETDFEFCKGCGICAKVCPAKCITMGVEEK